MTGFGSEVKIFQNKKISVEIKSLNSKNLDLLIKIPPQYKDKELEIRSFISQKFGRGKIDFTINIEKDGSNINADINKEILLRYYFNLEKICYSNNIPFPNDIINHLIKIPEIVEKQTEVYEEEEWKIVKSCLQSATEKCLSFREQEGKILEKEILINNNKILSLLSTIPEFEKERIETIKQRLVQNYDNISKTISIEKNRFEEEMFFYLEKLDINEEKIRLKKHCEYFIETMYEENSGKKLNFICQEIGREINTLGSKANHYEIQKIVIMMKDELEKIKEQILNLL
jgi:uncharacterized protein (TIGR00255 family)